MQYEKWSAGYWLLKQYIIFADWLIHKKIIITGKSQLPENKPVIFAPNHQNALSDPLAVLLHCRFQPVWLARADIFEISGFVNKILRFLKIMPVYRITDGKENLGKNEQTFACSIKVLENHFALALFPEAAHSGKRQMLMHKKAVPRIVFMAAEKTEFKLDMQIVPCGIYYSHYWKFNRILIVRFGNPIAVSGYFQDYRDNQGIAVQKLRNDLYDAIEELSINIKSKKYYNEFENIREVYGKHYLNRQQIQWSYLENYLSDIRLCRLLDKLEKEHPEETGKIARDIVDFIHSIKKLKIRSWLVEEKQNKPGRLFLNVLVLLILSPIALYGFLLNAVPFFITDRLIKKKVKDKTFLSSFFLATGILIFPLFYLLLFFTLGWIIPEMYLRIVLLIILPFTGKIAFQWVIGLKKAAGRFSMLRLKWLHKDKYLEIFSKKKRLFDLLDLLVTADPPTLKKTN